MDRREFIRLALMSSTLLAPGPFEVLSRIPRSRFHILSKDLSPVRDAHGFIITPEKALTDAPQLDVLVVPGGLGQEAVMHDEILLQFIQHQTKAANCTIRRPPSITFREVVRRLRAPARRDVRPN